MIHEMSVSDEQSVVQNEMIPTIGKIAGIVIFLLVWNIPMEIPPAAHRLLAVTVMMGIFWLTQAIPIAATSLIPLVAFPFLGIQTADVVSKSYINKNIFLFMGGFIIALGIERWGLHRRMALRIVSLVGSSLKQVILGFMLACGFLSMWISNTASTLLMLPIGLALLASLREASLEETSTPDVSSQADAKGPDPETNKILEHFSLVLMLGIAYSASLGGLSTLVGTPTNVTFVQIWEETFPRAPSISAGQWMSAVFPFTLVFLMITWWFLTWNLSPLPNQHLLQRSFFKDKLKRLGKPSKPETWMMIVFITTALLWILRTPLSFGSTVLVPGWGRWIELMLLSWGIEAEMAQRAVHDSTVAMGMALLMFFIPARRSFGKTEFLMDWETAEKLPWGILLLIGGGFAIANAFDKTGLSVVIGEQLATWAVHWPVWLLVGAVCFLMTFLTEFTSNVATVSTLLPILSATSLSIDIDPRLIMIPATISASCAFMLPIATPPNAIVFGSGCLQIGQMARYGIVLNLCGVLMLTAATFFLLCPALGIDPGGSLPAWGIPAVTP